MKKKTLIINKLNIIPNIHTPIYIINNRKYNSQLSILLYGKRLIMKSRTASQILFTLMYDHLMEYIEIQRDKQMVCTKHIYKFKYSFPFTNCNLYFLFFE